jgi:hypothetical protein
MLVTANARDKRSLAAEQSHCIHYTARITPALLLTAAMKDFMATGIISPKKRTGAFVGTANRKAVVHRQRYNSAVARCTVCYRSHFGDGCWRNVVSLSTSI